MLDFIKEKESVWDFLARTEKKIVLYGMGNGADKILEHLHSLGKKPAGIFASDEFVRGQKFHGLTVQNYQSIKAELGDFVVVLAFGSELPEVLERFYALAQAHQVVAPHVPVFPGDEIVSAAWLKTHAQELQEVYDHLADDFSRQVFAGALNYKISGKISYLQQITTARVQDLKNLFHFGTEEVYVDGGAYNGDTIKEFLQLTQGRYKKIFAVEPDKRNYKKLTEYVSSSNLANVQCLEKGLWSTSGRRAFSANSGRQATFVQPDAYELAKKALLADKQTHSAQKVIKPKTIPVPVTSIDDFVGEEQATYIKLDVEGTEVPVLQGAAQQLAGKPKLFIAAYHHDSDLFEIPLLLWKLQPNYKIYLRKHPYVPDWELNFLAL
jgi:FkbM family methyltransferase